RAERCRANSDTGGRESRSGADHFAAFGVTLQTRRDIDRVADGGEVLVLARPEVPDHRLARVHADAIPELRPRLAGRALKRDGAFEREASVTRLRLGSVPDGEDRIACEAVDDSARLAQCLRGDAVIAEKQRRDLLGS